MLVSVLHIGFLTSLAKVHKERFNQMDTEAYKGWWRTVYSIHTQYMSFVNKTPYICRLDIVGLYGIRWQKRYSTCSLKKLSDCKNSAI